MIYRAIGDAADGMYFIEEGTVSIKMLQDGGEKEISKLEKGQYFGELALVTHKPRAASVYAQSNVKVACKSIVFVSINIYFPPFLNKYSPKPSSSLITNLIDI